MSLKIKKKDLSNYKKSKNCSCPECNKIHNDNSEGYYINKIKYPKYFNESKGSNLDGMYHDWDELHCCNNCQTKFYFNNGIY